MHAQGGQAGVRAAVLHHSGIVASGTLSHGSRSFLTGTNPERKKRLSSFCQVSAAHTAATLGET